MNRMSREDAIFNFLNLLVQLSEKNNICRLKNVFDNYRKYFKPMSQETTSQLAIEDILIGSATSVVDNTLPNDSIDHKNNERTTTDTQFDEKGFIRNSLLTSDPQFSIFHQMKPEELDMLCRSIKYKVYHTRSVIFFQGDMSDTTYIIVSGSVDLYVDSSRSRESGLLAAASMGVEQSLGVFTKKLPVGTIFGDIPALSNTLLTRSASAVADRKTALFMVPVSTYLTVLRQFRGLQIRITSAIEILREFPAFKDHSHPKLTSIAFDLKYHSFPKHSEIALAGAPLQSVYIIQSGAVAVYSAYSRESTGAGAGGGSMHLSLHVIATLTKGMLIGDHEVRKKIKVYQLTYISVDDTEVAAMDQATYAVDVFAYQLRRERRAQLIHCPETFTFTRDISIRSLPGVGRSAGPAFGSPSKASGLSLVVDVEAPTDQPSIVKAIGSAPSPSYGPSSPAPGSIPSLRSTGPNLSGSLPMQPTSPGSTPDTRASPVPVPVSPPPLIHQVTLLFSERYSSDRHSKHLRTLHSRNNMFYSRSNLNSNLDSNLSSPKGAIASVFGTSDKVAPMASEAESEWDREIDNVKDQPIIPPEPTPKPTIGLAALMASFEKMVDFNSSSRPGKAGAVYREKPSSSRPSSRHKAVPSSSSNASASASASASAGVGVGANTNANASKEQSRDKGLHFSRSKKQLIQEKKQQILHRCTTPNVAFRVKGSPIKTAMGHGLYL